MMTLTSDDAKTLKEETRRVTIREASLNTARRAQKTAIRNAAQNGATVREIAEVARISHQRVHQIIGEKP